MHGVPSTFLLTKFPQGFGEALSSVYYESSTVLLWTLKNLWTLTITGSILRSFALMQASLNYCSIIEIGPIRCYLIQTSYNPTLSFNVPNCYNRGNLCVTYL